MARTIYLLRDNNGVMRAKISNRLTDLMLENGWEEVDDWFRCNGDVEAYCFRKQNLNSMEHKDFRIGEYFFTATGRWKCTDVGSRVIVAIKVPRNPEHETGEVWSGPPFCLVEHVFDEDDFGGCNQEDVYE
jgi:hypothetical protein